MRMGKKAAVEEDERKLRIAIVSTDRCKPKKHFRLKLRVAVCLLASWFASGVSRNAKSIARWCEQESFVWRQCSLHFYHVC